MWSPPCQKNLFQFSAIPDTGKFFFISKLDLPLLNLIPLILVLCAPEVENSFSLALSQCAFHVPEGCCLVSWEFLFLWAFQLSQHTVFKASGNLSVIQKMCLTSFYLVWPSSEGWRWHFSRAQQYCTSQALCSFMDGFLSIICTWPEYIGCTTWTHQEESEHLCFWTSAS